MRAAYVPPVRTPLTWREAAHCLRWALGMPRPSVLALALAKSALETGRWSAIWGYNWGNVKASTSYAGMYTCITLNEVLPARGVVWFAPEGELSGDPKRGGALVGAPLPVPEGHPQTRMRVYASAYDGALSYATLLEGRFPVAWAALQTGDPIAYVHALKRAGYFTADEEPYARAVASLHREFSACLARLVPPEVDRDWESMREIVPRLQIPLEPDA